MSAATEAVQSAPPQGQPIYSAVRTHFIAVLSEHGVTSKGFGHCHNAIYRPILGFCAATFRRRHALKPTESPHLAMTPAERDDVMLAMTRIADRIVELKAFGDEACLAICHAQAQRIGVPRPAAAA